MSKKIEWKKSEFDYDALNKLTPQQLTRIENGKLTISENASYESRQRGGLNNKKSGHISELGKKYGGKFFNPNGPSHETKLMGAKSMAEKSSRVILQFNLDGTLVKEWNSMNDAKRAGYIISSISRCCNNKLKSTQGFVWKFKD